METSHVSVSSAGVNIMMMFLCREPMEEVRVIPHQCGCGGTTLPSPNDDLAGSWKAQEEELASAPQNIPKDADSETPMNPLGFTGTEWLKLLEACRPFAQEIPMIKTFK